MPARDWHLLLQRGYSRCYSARSHCGRRTHISAVPARLVKPDTRQQAKRILPIRRSLNETANYVERWLQRPFKAIRVTRIIDEVGLVRPYGGYTTYLPKDQSDVRDEARGSHDGACSLGEEARPEAVTARRCC